MTTSVTFNGTVYDLPVTGDSNSWGDSTTNFFIDLAANTLTVGSSKLKVRIATTTPVTVLSTDAAVLTNLSSPSAVAVSLPVGVTNQYYVIGDGAGNATTYPLTITGSSGQQIDGNSTFTINWNYGCIGVLYTGSQWKVINIYRPQTLSTFPSRVSNTTATTVTSNDSVVILTYNGNRTVSLPTTPTNGTQISLIDGTDAYTYPIVITPSSGTINGTSSFTFKELSATCLVEYDSSSTNWSILSISKTPVIRRLQSDGSNPIIIETTAASNQNVQIAPNQSTQLTINPPTAANADAVFNGTAAITSPKGTTAQRPSTPVEGMKRYNTDTSKREHYVNGAWRNIADETNTATLTNKSLSDTTTTIINAVDNTKKVIISASGITTGTTRTLTSPDANTTIVGTDATQTLSNKSFDTTDVTVRSAKKIIFNNSGNTFATSLKAGANAVNLDITLPISAPAANQVLTSTDTSGTLGWSTVATTVGAVSANDSNVTFTNGDNRSQTCTPTAARTYTLPTTSISAGDTWEFFNQSTTDGRVITLNASGGATVGKCYPTGRIVLRAKVTTPTTASDWLVVNNTSSWVAWTPTAGVGFGTITAAGGFYRIKDNSEAEFRGGFTSGTIAGTIASIGLPSTITVNSSYLSRNTSTTSNTGNIVGTYGCNSAGNFNYIVTAPGTSTTDVYVAGTMSGVSNMTPGTGTGVATSTSLITFQFSIPI